MSHYPQMPPLTASEIQEFLQHAPIARLGSLNPDGTQHLAPVSFRLHDGALLIGTQRITRKARNIARNANVSVLVDNCEMPYQAVLIYGSAALIYDDALALRRLIFEKYMPAEQAAELAHSLAAQHTPVVIRVRPERTVSFDYAKG
jgi:PPOX class probable F420-dependent enzyme